MLEPLTNQSLIVGLVILLAAAVVSDVMSRTIPNTLVGVGLIAGIFAQCYLGGFLGLGMSVLGVVVGLVCLLPFYVVGGMGAGDVKLMAMCGAFLGPFHVFVASAATLVIGGVIGVLWMLWHLSPGLFGGIRLEEPATDGDAVPGPATGDLGQIPYALAIAAGVIAEIAAAPAITLAWTGANLG